MLAIEIFAGAGGMSLGASQAGIDVRIAIEKKQAACLTYSKNHPSTKVIQADIRDVETVNVGHRDQELIVFGGPPCQGFSTSNQRTRNRKNTDNWLFLEFLRILKQIRPEWVVFENVSGILQTDGGSFVRNLERRLRNLGYRLSVGLLNAIDFGVPQSRERFFVVGSCDHDPPDLTAMNPRETTPIGVWEAIGDLPVLRNGSNRDIRSYRTVPKSDYVARLRGRLSECSGHIVTKNADNIIERYSHIPQGGNWRDIPAKLMHSYSDPGRCHTGIYRRLSAEKPAIVIGNFRKNMLIHPTQNRGLSVREAARLQSFPDSYDFLGSIGLQQQQVGNANQLFFLALFPI